MPDHYSGSIIGRRVRCDIWELLTFYDDNEGTIIDSDEHTYLVNFGYKTVRINKRALILI
jgi:hypothetical protein|tara:strand:- start:94 stop:273 length:180 start_codon:yes stop_codon:yes gene_type:complete